MFEDVSRRTFLKGTAATAALAAAGSLSLGAWRAEAQAACGEAKAAAKAGYES